MAFSTTEEFSASMVSVISASRSLGSSWYFSTRSEKICGTSRFTMSTTDTFTDTGTRLLPLACHFCSVWQTASQMYWSSREIRPVLSSRGMNSDGCTQPRVGWFQRTSASMPTMARVMLLHLGCRKKVNSWLSSACSSSLSSYCWALRLSSMAGAKRWMPLPEWSGFITAIWA